jgi:type I restriction enzyme S subunit
MTGIIGGISLAKFLRLAIPVPPKAEQERIVAKVDELMQLCDALESHTKNSLDTHNTLVETILADFTSGSAPEENTPTWSRMAKHFDTLFTTNESIEKLKNTVLELAFSGFLNTSNAAGSYEQKYPFKNHKLGQMLKHNCGISYGVIKLGVEPEDGGVPTLRCSDVKPGHIVRSDVRRVSHEIEKEYLRTRLKGGEVVLNIRGTLGGVAKVPGDMEGFNVAREVAVIPIGDQILADYLVYFLRSPTFWIYLENNLRGIAYKGLNLGILRELEIPLPDLETQTRLVGLIDSIFETCDSICDSLDESNEKAGQFLDSLFDKFGGAQACV